MATSNKNELEELINVIVNQQIKRFSDLQDFFGKLDHDTIWTNSYYTVQLQGEMERTMHKLFQEDTKKVVKQIIRYYHLKTIKKRPELKEY